MSANMDVSDPNAVQDNVKEYYGKVLSGTKDLKTSVCTVGKSKVPKHAREALKLVHDGVTSKYVFVFIFTSCITYLSLRIVM